MNGDVCCPSPLGAFMEVVVPSPLGEGGRGLKKTCPVSR